jgi:adenine-specific DNA-methyltransferase
MNVECLGQVFTEIEQIEFMINLRKYNESVLEPSCGEGRFLKYLSKNYTTSIEIDRNICPSESLNIDFFDYSEQNKFKTIIGNPPYVAYKNILRDTKMKLPKIFDKRTNLYVFFIFKCLNHLDENGELIFITPKDFTTSTSSVYLNRLLYETGTMTHFFDFSDKKIFKNYSPNTCIWRFEKDNFSRKTITNNGEKTFSVKNGIISFSNERLNVLFSDIFYVKVGGVSGYDSIFKEHSGNIDVVDSTTCSTGRAVKFHYNDISYLEKYKIDLLNRKIRRFSENNWWKWGREFYISDDKRVYVNARTRKENPFFCHECKLFDGSVLGIFLKNQDLNEIEICEMLNNVDWDEIGFKTGGRLIFSQRSLENCMLPENFNKLKGEKWTKKEKEL